MRFTMKTQKCKESAKIDKEIGKEKLWRKFEVEKFNFFEISNLESIEWIFPYVSTFWADFGSSLNFIRHFNVHLNLNSVLKKEVMMRNIKSIYFVNTNDRMDCYPFFDEKKWELFVERKRYFCSSVIEIGMEIGGSDYYFVLKVSEMSESQIFLYSENQNENIVTGKDEIGQLLKLNGGSRIEGCSSFSRTKSTPVIRIEDSVEIVGEEDFHGYESLDLYRNKWVISKLPHIFRYKWVISI
jgi:hypothetical protein